MNRLKMVYIALAVGMAAAIITAISVTIVDQQSSDSSSANNSAGDNNDVTTAPSVAPVTSSLQPSAVPTDSAAPSFLRGPPTVSPTGVAPTVIQDQSMAPTVVSATVSPSQPPVLISDSRSLSPTISSESPSQATSTSSPPSESTVLSTAPTSTSVDSGAPSITPSQVPSSMPTTLTTVSSTTRVPSSSPSSTSTTASTSTSVPSSTPSTTTGSPSASAPTAGPDLVAPSTGSFKILQLTDLHQGESPEQDQQTWSVLQTVLTLEQPDLVILSGDVLSAKAMMDDSALAYYEQLGNVLSQYNTPWALLFGEADDAPYVDVSLNTTTPARTTRADLVELDQQFDLSLTQSGPPSVFGTSNYVLDVYNTKNEVAAQLVMLDTGGGSLGKELTTSQLTWFQQERSNVPALVFQHIPSSDQFLFDNARCVGVNGDDGINALTSDGGMMSAIEQDGNVWVVGVGHNHGNGYCCSLQTSSTTHVCFGRHSGHGGYSGVFGRGARVYELEFVNDIATSWKSWVRLEYGFTVDEYDP